MTMLGDRLWPPSTNCTRPILLRKQGPLPKGPCLRRRQLLDNLNPQDQKLVRPTLQHPAPRPGSLSQARPSLSCAGPRKLQNPFLVDSHISRKNTTSPRMHHQSLLLRPRIARDRLQPTTARCHAKVSTNVKGAFGLACHLLLVYLPLLGIALVSLRQQEPLSSEVDPRR